MRETDKQTGTDNSDLSGEVIQQILKGNCTCSCYTVWYVKMCCRNTCTMTVSLKIYMYI